MSGDRYNILQVVDVKDPDKDYFLYVEKNGTAIHHVYSDSKTRDSFHRKIVESYRGFNIIDDWKKGVYVINKNGKDLNFENTPNDCKDWIDDYIKAPGARDSKTKDNLYWRIADLKNKIAAINNDISNNTMARHYSGSPDTPESKEWYNKKDRERTELKNQIAELEARIKDLKSKGINPVDVKDAGAVCRECGKSYDPDKSDVHDPDEADKFCSSQCEAAHRSGGAEHRMNKDNYREGLQKLRDQLEEAKQKGDKDRVGDLEIEIADFIKETADANMVIGDELFDAQMIERLRSGYANINTIDPSKPTYGNLIILLNRLDKDQLKQLADANIKFVSKLARNRVRDKIVECPNCKNQLTCTDEDNGKAKYECGVCGKKYVSKDKRTKYSNIDKETKECFNFNMDNQRSKTKDDYKRMTVKELQDKAKQGYFELQGDLKPRNHVEVKYPDGKKEWVFVEDQEIKIIIGDDPKDPSPAEQKVESNDVIYKEYTLKQLPETGEFEIYAPGGSIVGHAKALELAKLFVDRIVASLVSDAKTKDVMSERRA